MTKGRTIDLESQFMSLFNTEEMIAFFDFQLKPTGCEPVEGLCKVSRPKEGKQGGKYFSLLMIIDTPTEAARSAVEASLKRINWEDMKLLLPEFQCVLPIAYHNKAKENFLAEFDVYMSEDCELSRAYILQNLYPAIIRVSSFSKGELIFWDNTKYADKTPAREEKSNQSLLQRLKEILFFKHY